MANASGTDVAGYLTESPGFSAFTLDDGVVYQTYQTWWRGLEFLMGYPIPDRTLRAATRTKDSSSGSAATTSTTASECGARGDEGPARGGDQDLSSVRRHAFSDDAVGRPGSRDRSSSDT